MGIITKNLVIATGGASYPKTGSSGDGYRLAASLGHPVTGIGPALTPLMIKNFPFADLAGISFPGLPFSVWRENRKISKGGGMCSSPTPVFPVPVSSIVRAIYGREM